MKEDLKMITISRHENQEELTNNSRYRAERMDFVNIHQKNMSELNFYCDIVDKVINRLEEGF